MAGTPFRTGGRKASEAEEVAELRGLGISGRRRDKATRPSPSRQGGKGTSPAKGGGGLPAKARSSRLRVQWRHRPIVRSRRRRRSPRRLRPPQGPHGAAAGIQIEGMSDDEINHAIKARVEGG